MLFSSILDFSLKNHLIIKGQTIVVGLSGGPDSVFMLHFLKYYALEYDLKLIAAHLDHEWRSNSQEDSNFCKNLAQELQLKHFSYRDLENNTLETKLVNIIEKCYYKDFPQWEERDIEIHYF